MATPTEPPSPAAFPSGDRPRVLIIDPDSARAECHARALRDRLGCTTRVLPSVLSPKQRLTADVVVCDADAADHDTIARLAGRCHPRPLVVATLAESDAQTSMWILAGAHDAVVRDSDAIVAAVVRAAARARRGAAATRLNTRACPEPGARLDRRLHSLVAFLEAAATTDPLTGLANRRAFEARIHQVWASTPGLADDVSVVVLDIDNFKQVNDRGGHGAGDQVLVYVAASLRSQCRRADLAARIGGDEFVLLLPGVGNEEAARVAERLRQDFAMRCMSSCGICEGAGAMPSYSLSAGVASRRETGAISPTALVKEADRALYMAKRNGKDCVRSIGGDGGRPWSVAS